MYAYLLYAYSNSNSRPQQPAAGLCFGQVRKCNTVNCCHIAAALLFHCCCTDAAALLLPCRVAALLMHCCCFAELLHCFCYIAAALLPIAAALLLLRCCSMVAALLLTSCNAVVLLLPCYCFVALLLHVAALLYCSCIVAALLYCCCLAALLLYCCFFIAAALLNCCLAALILWYCCCLAFAVLLLCSIVADSLLPCCCLLHCSYIILMSFCWCFYTMHMHMKHCLHAQIFNLTLSWHLQLGRGLAFSAAIKSNRSLEEIEKLKAVLMPPMSTPSAHPGLMQSTPLTTLSPYTSQQQAQASPYPATPAFDIDMTAPAAAPSPAAATEQVPSPPKDHCDCGDKTGSVHKCDKCGRHMHPWCGQQLGEEGFGQQVRCKGCGGTGPPE